MSRLPDSTENNRERITEQEDREIASGLAADQRARFGEPAPTTVDELVRQHFLGDIETPNDLHQAIYKLGVEAGRTEKQKEWDAWIEKHQAEADPIADEVLHGSSWRRRHDA